jgi:methionyl-tRNA formyltransferase
MIKIIVFGNQKICIDCLNILRRKKDVEIGFVVGCELPRDKTFGYPSVRKYCKENNIKFYNPTVLDERILKLVENYKPDLCFSIYYRLIFKPPLINIPKMGFINFHSGLLPAYRGPAPTMWAIVKGENYSGMTIHYIDKGIDTGDIIVQKKVKIYRNTTGSKLNDKVMSAGVRLFRENIDKLLEGKNARRAQTKSGISYFGRFVPSVRNINWFDNKHLVERRVKALTKPYSGALAKVAGKQMVIWDAISLNRPLRHYGGPGRIVEVLDDHSFIVTTIDGYIRVLKYEFLNVRKRIYQKYIVKGVKFEI